jgi:hypothetical protein
MDLIWKSLPLRRIIRNYMPFRGLYPAKAMPFRGIIRGKFWLSENYTLERHAFPRHNPSSLITNIFAKFAEKFFLTGRIVYFLNTVQCYNIFGIYCWYEIQNVRRCVNLLLKKGFLLVKRRPPPPHIRGSQGKMLLFWNDGRFEALSMEMRNL